MLTEISVYVLSNVGDPDPHVFGLPDPNLDPNLDPFVRGMDPDPTLFS
jgi:hypothetical protein